MSTTTMPILAEPAVAYAERTDTRLFKRARTWVMLLTLFLLADGNSLFTEQDTQYWSLTKLHQEQSTPILLFLTVLMCALCTALVLTRITATLRIMVKQKVIMTFAILAFCSSLWSEDPVVTMKHAVLLFLSFALAWFFSGYYTPADQRRILLALGAIMALASIAMALFLPQYGISSDGEWKGVFGQKNRLGLSMLFLFSGLPFVRIPNRRRLLSLSLQALLPISLILLSKSIGSLILAILLILVRVSYPFVSRMRKSQLPLLTYCLIVGLPLGGFVIKSSIDFILPLLGKDSTLSGRTDHWTIIAGYATRHPWLGYGFEGFWTGTGDSAGVMKSIGATMRGSDSGYIDTFLMFGLVGMGMLIVLYLVCARDFLRMVRLAPPLMAYWYVAIILITIVGSFTEMLLLSSGFITPFIIVVACAQLRRMSDGYGTFPTEPSTVSVR